MIKEIWILIALAAPPGTVHVNSSQIIGTMETASKEECTTKAHELIEEWDTKVAPVINMEIRIACVKKQEDTTPL